MRDALLLLALSACGDAAPSPPPVFTAAPEPVRTTVPLPETQPWPEPDWRLAMARHETRFADSGKDAGRAVNVALAADLNEGVIEPGDEYSFNLRVGPRERWRGFVDAPTIFLGEVVPDVGGGVCQVSSTLHVAALLAGLEVVDRTPHSRVPKYVQAGLDATVSWPAGCDGECVPTDLVVRNPFDFPVGIASTVRRGPSGTSFLRVEVWGHAPVLPVSFSSRTGLRKEFSRRRREDGRAAAPRRKQEGADGRTVWTDVHYGWVGVSPFVSVYRPVDEIWEVPPGYDGPDPWCARKPDLAGCTEESFGGVEQR